MRLSRPEPQRSSISLVSMVDVLMIMLIFFMVTSTFLNLRMVPMTDPGTAAAAAAPGAQSAAGATPLLLRLGADGRAYLRGKARTPDALATFLADRVAANPALTVVILPSGRASMQDLVTLSERIRTAGVARLRVVRVEGAE